MSVLLAVKESIHATQCVVEEDRQRSTISQPEAIRIEHERYRTERRTPRSGAARGRADPPELTLQTATRAPGRRCKELRHPSRNFRIHCATRIEDEGAVVRVAIAVDVASHQRRVPVA